MCNNKWKDAIQEIASELNKVRAYKKWIYKLLKRNRELKHENMVLKQMIRDLDKKDYIKIEDSETGEICQLSYLEYNIMEGRVKA